MAKKNPFGTYCWVDRGAIDVGKMKKFYRSIFGWTSRDELISKGDTYTLFSLGKTDIGGVYPRTHEERKAREKPAWLPYVLVKDVDAAVKKVKAARGKLCFGPLDVMDKGRLAVIADPTGAPVGLWRPRGKPETSHLDKPGTVCWHDLNTPRVKAAAEFYRKVFGWRVQAMDFSGNSYNLLKLGKEGIGGIWPHPHPKLPSCWLTYWQVADCKKTVAKIKKLKGKILMDVVEVPNTARFAIVTDPEGAPFGILTPIRSAAQKRKASKINF